MSAASARLPGYLVACEARHADGWVCTARKGHEGVHQAFVDRSMVATWSDTGRVHDTDRHRPEENR